MPRLFEPDALVGGSIISDFIHSRGWTCHRSTGTSGPGYRLPPRLAEHYREAFTL